MSTHLQTLPSTNDHLIGSLHALVVIVEYGDFECPYCGIFAQVIEQLLSEFKSDICFIYRHFPLNKHPNAMFAALAAEAAHKQSEFWNMYSLLYQNYDRLSSQLINECATELDLDMSQLRKDIEDQKTMDRVNLDIDSGKKNNVTGTPSVFINGEFMEETVTYNSLREKIVRMIDEGQATFI